MWPAWRGGDSDLIMRSAVARPASYGMTIKRTPASPPSLSPPVSPPSHSPRHLSLAFFAPAGCLLLSHNRHALKAPYIVSVLSPQFLRTTLGALPIQTCYIRTRQFEHPPPHSPSQPCTTIHSRLPPQHLPPLAPLPDRHGNTNIGGLNPPSPTWPPSSRPHTTTNTHHPRAPQTSRVFSIPHTRAARHHHRR